MAKKILEKQIAADTDYGEYGIVRWDDGTNVPYFRLKDQNEKPDGYDFDWKNFRWIVDESRSIRQP